MINPVVQNRKYLMTYISIWVLVTGTHFAVFYLILDLSLTISILDSSIFNFSFALLGLSIWYVVRYNDFEIRKLPELLLHHILIVAIIISGWIFISNFILRIITDDPAYHQFVSNAISGRYIGGLFYYLITILVFYLIVYYQENQDQQIRTAHLSGQLKDAELNVLKNQINPHFLFNSLNSISSLTLTDPEKARAIITKLSDFLRVLLKENNQSKTNLEKELDHIRLYLDIEKSRFGEKMIFDEDVKDDCLDAEIPSLLLLPLVENAVKHGVQNSTIPVTINMIVQRKKDNLEISIENNFESGLINKGTGLGLKNIRERLALIYEKQSVEIMHSENVFKVVLTMPFNKDEK